MSAAATRGCAENRGTSWRLAQDGPPRENARLFAEGMASLGREPTVLLCRSAWAGSLADGAETQAMGYLHKGRFEGVGEFLSDAFALLSAGERPDSAAAQLMEGRVLILCDTSPRVMVLPTSLLDLLLAGNITLSAVVLLTVMYIRHPLEFSSFPSLLLALTLVRLVLNTATTRLILTNAQDGTAAAGHVIEVFGDFVAAGSLAVGIIIFTILTVIQFVVITKGATRIAEVAARFTLDGMPGKQMAIDADLNAGLINEAEARRRREEITAEADFYGAMDGASKFVRGDAIAGLIITIVNILGGIYVGMVEHGMPIMECLRVFSKLTIGDGLVAAIPAFITSVSAGMLVTRSSSKSNLGEDMLGQLTARPIALILAAVFLGFLSLTPLPKLPLLLLAAGCGGVAFFLSSARTADAAAVALKAKQEARKPERVETLLAVDPMELEVGYGLIRLVDRKQGGDLLDRITNIRRQIATDLGIVVPPIRVRDHLRLEPNQYVVKVRGVEVARGECMPWYLLAINNGMVTAPVAGIETVEPAFGLPALWISEELKADAEQ